MQLIRPTLYLILLFFIMQLDAYLYLLGVIDVRPNIQVLIAFFFLSFIYFFKRGCTLVRFSRKSSILLTCLLIYIFSQIAGILTWEIIPGDLKILFLWVYMILLLFIGGMSGVIIGDRVPYFMFGVLVILVAIMSLDTLLGGVSISQAWGRSASTLRNPNAAAFVVAILMLGAFRWQRIGFLEVFAIIAGGVGVILTQSRGGVLVYFLVVISISVWWCSLGGTFGVRVKRYLVAGLFVLTIVSTLITYLIVSRYGMGGIDLALSDANYRDQAFYIALNLINEKPLFGHGTGFVYTQEMGPHNMILRVLVENGVLGLIGLLSLLIGIFCMGIVKRSPSIITLSIVLIMISMTTHNLTEARSILIVTGMLLVHPVRRRLTKLPLRITSYKRERIVLS